MKFAHFADCHIGGWREPELRQLGIDAFRKAVEICIERNVGFLLISGDLFDTSLPSIDLIKEVAEILDKLRSHDINVYIIAGSHDFSHSGKTIIDVFEKAGLLENVVKFKDGKLQFSLDKTNVKITGLYGKKGGLEILDYEKLDKKSLEEEKGFKIFMFHTALEEFKPKELEKIQCQSVKALPKNFDYYAGGHVHYIFNTKYDKGLLVYPGALFPNNFKELEEFKHGGFYIVDNKLSLEYIPIKLREVISFDLNVNGMSSKEAEEFILKQIKGDFRDKIITLRVTGVLESGEISDIDFKKINKEINAFVILRNISKLITKQFEELDIDTGNIDEIEEKIIKEHLGQSKIQNEKELIKNLMDILSLEKMEGEKNIDFENRLIKNALKIFEK